MQDAAVGTARLANPKDAVEAEGIRLFLEEQGIESNVVCFQDAAYPGVVDRERLWGEVRVAERDLERARGALQQWQAAPAVDEPPIAGAPEAADAPRRQPTVVLLWVVFLVGLGLLLARQLWS